ncbi:MAG: 6-phosphofructokinase [Eubacteriales bacterium]|nr:6-phosphofructokinase [Eubacteriales bacterium]
MKKINIIVGQSGGPTAVINSSLYGVIKEAFESDEIANVYGMVHGIEGFMNGEYINLRNFFDEKDKLELLRRTPAAFLGSCRYKLPEDITDISYKRVFEAFEKLEIGAFFYIGGNDSMDTVSKLQKAAELYKSEVRFIGVPKTVDNDLVNTDHTPGYGSAAKYIASTVRDVIFDAGVYRNPVVTIIEIMGRHAGWLTAASALAGGKYSPNPMLIYLPEVAFDMDNFIKDLKVALSKNNSVVVCVSEGIIDADGKLICEYEGDSAVDGFGHKMLAGCGKVLERKVKAELNIKCRSIELNLPQRCSSVLASLTDIEEAAGVGKSAVKAALRGESGKMVCMERDDSYGYKVNYVTKDVSEICNFEKKFPAEWINSTQNGIKKEFIDYVLPLIQGENKTSFKNGLPEYIRLENM